MMLDAGFRRVCPIQPHFLFKICLATGSCPARSHRSSFEIISSFLEAQMFLSMTMAALDLPILAVTSLSVPSCRGGAVEQLSKVFCPSLQLFLYCRQWFSVFILYRHVSLLELACQLLSGQVQVFKITLTGCFLRLTGQVIDVVPFVFPDAPLYFPICCCVFCLCL